MKYLIKHLILILLYGIVYQNAVMAQESETAENQTHYLNYKTPDGIYMDIELESWPKNLGYTAIYFQQKRVVITGVTYNDKHYNDNELSAYGINFPLTSRNTMLGCEGSACFYLELSWEVCGDFRLGGGIDGVQYQYTGSTEVKFSEYIKKAHDEALKSQDGSPWQKTGRVQSVKIILAEGLDINKINEAVREASKFTDKLNKAKREFENGNYDEALNICKNAERINANDPELASLIDKISTKQNSNNIQDVAPISITMSSDFSSETDNDDSDANESDNSTNNSYQSNFKEPTQADLFRYQVERDQQFQTDMNKSIHDLSTGIANLIEQDRLERMEQMHQKYLRETRMRGEHYNKLSLSNDSIKQNLTADEKKYLHLLEFQVVDLMFTSYNNKVIKVEHEYDAVDYEYFYTIDFGNSSRKEHTSMPHLLNYYSNDYVDYFYCKSYEIQKDMYSEEWKNDRTRPVNKLYPNFYLVGHFISNDNSKIAFYRENFLEIFNLNDPNTSEKIYPSGAGKGNLLRASFSPDNQYIASIIRKKKLNKLIIINISQEKELTNIEIMPNRPVEFMDNQYQILIPTLDSTIGVYDFKKNTMVRTIEIEPYLFSLSPENSKLINYNPDKELFNIYNFTEGNLICSYEISRSMLNNIVFTKNDKYMIIGTNENIIFIDLKTGEFKKTFKTSFTSLDRIEISQCGKYLICFNAADLFHTYALVLNINKMILDL